MGQAESAESQQDNCFRLCLKQKRLSTNKNNELPNNHKKPQKVMIITHTNTHQTIENRTNLQKTSNQQLSINNLEKQHQKQLVVKSTQTDCLEPNKITKLEASNNIIQQKNNQVQLRGTRVKCNDQVNLKLQPKLWSNKKKGISGSSKGNQAKESANNWGGGSSRTNFLSHLLDGQRQDRTQQQIVINTKSKTKSSSRNLLLNKIQQIKLKYFQRELEIQIYQDDHQYQAQIDQINQIEDNHQKHRNCVTFQSIHQISAIKNNIIDKLKNKKAKQNEALSNCLDTAYPEVCHKQTSIRNKHELYSNDDKIVLEQSVKIPILQRIKSSQQLKHAKQQKITFSKYKNKQNENSSAQCSLNVSLQNQSSQNPVQFSEYSFQNTLQQIRQVDEEEQQFKSKIAGEKYIKRLQKQTPQTLSTSHHKNVVSKPFLRQHSSKKNADHEQKGSILSQVTSRVMCEQFPKKTPVPIFNKAESLNHLNNQNPPLGANISSMTKSKKVMLF